MKFIYDIMYVLKFHFEILNTSLLKDELNFDKISLLIKKYIKLINSC